MSERQTYGIAWCDGGDPEDGGWHFDDGSMVDGYDMAYNTGSREEAYDLGVSEAVLDLFEASLAGKTDKDESGYGGTYGLFGWLQDHSELFRS